MYRALLMAAMAVAVFGVAIDTQNDISIQKQRQLRPIAIDEPLTNSENNNHVYSTPIERKSSYQHFYPTYPEYTAEQQGYAVQTGYEGYMTPVAQQTRKPSWASETLALVALPAYALSLRAGAFIWNAFLLLVVGGIIMTAVCTFTPLCTITFAGLTKALVKEQVSDLARAYITPESMSAATLLVTGAIDKYAELQRQQQREEEMKTMNNTKTEKRRRR